MHPLQRHRFAIAAGVLFLAAAFLHFWRLAQAPSGFFVDEAGIGYAAQGIALDGRDEHGVAWPLFFEGFGDYKNPIDIYLVAAVAKIFGANVVVIRAIPSALALLAAVALGWIVWELFRERLLALATFAVAAVLPWLFMTAREGFEAAAQPACLAAFLGFWLLALRERSYAYALGAGGMLGLSAYAYSTGRLFMPLLVLALAVSTYPWREARRVFACGGLAILLWVPAILWSHAHHDALTARYTLLSILNGATGPFDVLARFWRVYTSFFSVTFLFEDTYFIQGGELFVTLVPLLLLGIVGLWRRRDDPFWRLVALGLLLAPVPGALTTDFGHQLRDVEAAPFWVLLAALGAHEGAATVRRPHLRWVAAVLALAIAVEAGSFLSDYFTRYPDRVADWNESGLGSAVAVAEEAAHAPNTNGTVAVSTSIFGGDVLYPWYAGEDVATYRRGGLSAIGGSYEDVSRGERAGTVELTTANETVPRASLLRTIDLTYTDDWGKPQSRPVYRIWRSL